MQIESWPIDRPVPYARNARKISQKAVDKVAASIKEFGWKQPIVVDGEGVIIVGHTRLQAARKLAQSEVPVVIASDLTPSQVKAYRLMDNRSNQETDWDIGLLAVEMGDLKSLCDVDLALTGFDAAEINKLLAPTEEQDAAANETPLLPGNPVSRLGDLWVLGNHRLLCGDSTKAEDVARVLNGQKPGLMVTDPPYGVEYDPEWREDAGFGKQKQTGRVANDDVFDWTPSWSLFPGSVAYVWCASWYLPEVAVSLKIANLERRSLIIWRKQSLTMSRDHYHWQHEPCWYSVRKGSTAKWSGDRKQSTMWDVANLNHDSGEPQDKKVGHGTQKPVELFRRPMQNHDFAQVYEPFCGSGTSIIAAEQADRSCFAIELDPKYVDVIVKRWEKFTGKQAFLEAEGNASFSSAQAERQAEMAVA